MSVHANNNEAKESHENELNYNDGNKNGNVNGNNNNSNNSNSNKASTGDEMVLLMSLMSNLDLSDYRKHSKNREYLELRLANDLKQLGYANNSKETVNKLVDIISNYL